MRNAFTMIELIFVIVIIGILAAVSIPKFSATRDDSTQTAILSEFKRVVTTISTSAMTSGQMNDLRTLFGVGGNIMSVTSDKLEIGDSVNNLICATLDTSDGLDINITIQNRNSNCILFADEINQEVTILGFEVIR